MLTVDEIIVARKPGTVIDSRVQTLKILAAQQTNQGAWGEQYTTGVALLVLHWLELDSRSASAVGAVTAEKEGQLSRSYGASGFDSELAGTVFGAEYMRLMRTIPSFAVRGMHVLPKG